MVSIPIQTSYLVINSLPMESSLGRTLLRVVISFLRLDLQARARTMTDDRQGCARRAGLASPRGISPFSVVVVIPELQASGW